MRVVMYSPDKMYGFCGTDDPPMECFFHLGVFVAGHWPGETPAPPPILGEEVLVECPPVEEPVSKAPRATRVERTTTPQRVTGTVETFNIDRGWGFVLGEDGVSYYLHRSEVQDGRLPLQGQQAVFYAGFKTGRPRACHVRVG